MANTTFKGTVRAESGLKVSAQPPLRAHTLISSLLTQVEM